MIVFLTLLTTAIVLPVIAYGQSTIEGMADSVYSTLTVVGTTIIFIGWLIAGILWLVSAGSPEKTGIAGSNWFLPKADCRHKKKQPE